VFTPVFESSVESLKWAMNTTDVTWKDKYEVDEIVYFISSISSSSINSNYFICLCLLVTASSTIPITDRLNCATVSLFKIKVASENPSWFRPVLYSRNWDRIRKSPFWVKLSLSAWAFWPNQDCGITSLTHGEKLSSPPLVWFPRSFDLFKIHHQGRMWVLPSTLLVVAFDDITDWKVRSK